jgi:hypothetical protein
MQELKNERILVRQVIDGKIVRFAKRFYENEERVFAAICMLDGPEEAQGFYIVNGERGMHVKQAKTWEEVESLIDRGPSASPQF